MEEKKRLTRSNNKMIGGVCAGLAEYLDIDPTIVRIVWVLMVLSPDSVYCSTLYYG